MVSQGDRAYFNEWDYQLKTYMIPWNNMPNI